MGRDPRVWEAGSVYHVVPKGNDGHRLFFDDRDRRDFLVRLDAAAEKYDARFVAYCFMDNHVHCLVHSGEAGLSELFQVVLGGFSRRRNRRHSREGHSFKNRVFSLHVETDAHSSGLPRDTSS